MNRARAVLCVVLAFGASYCSDGPTAPRPGHFLVALAGAGANDGALLVEIAGADTTARIDTVVVAPGSSYRVFARRRAQTQWRAIVTGTIVNGTLLQVNVPDASKSALYRFTVLDVADAAFAQLAPGARMLSVAR